MKRSSWSNARDLPKISALVAVIGVIWVTLWQMHPALVFANTLDNGGDTGAHVAMASYLGHTLLPSWHLTGWYPGWYDGYPIYSYYFVLPDLFAALGAHVIGFNVAFKLATLLGSVLLPICAYAMGRLFGLKGVFPSALAVATLPFLFDTTFSMDGGNLISTLQGEYSFSLSLSVALLVVGLIARGVKTGRGKLLTPVVAMVCLAAHFVPYFYVIVMGLVVGILAVLPKQLRGDATLGVSEGIVGQVEELDRGGVVRWVLIVGGLCAALSAWWVLPFAVGQRYTNPMGYTNDTAYIAHLFPRADLWVAVLALCGVFYGMSRKSRFSATMALGLVVFGLAYRFLPQGSLWNERLIPLWFISMYLLMGYFVGGVATELARRWRRGHARELGEASSAPGAQFGPLVLLLLALLVVVPPLIPNTSFDRALSKIGVTAGSSQISSWADWNYSGYQRKPAWPEYHAIMTMMNKVGARYGCGRAMWEYNSDQNRFGTTMSLMLLPYWTNNCIGSQEGLVFESSATTPYHFLIQAEVSQSPSNPQVGLPYGGLDVALGVQHLRMLGVRYFITETPAATAQAAALSSLTKIDSTGPWVGGSTWTVWLIKDSPVVVGLHQTPTVVPGIDKNHTSWLNANVSWFLNPSAWGHLLAASGPASWARSTEHRSADYGHVANPTRISHLVMDLQRMSFDSSQLGKPVLVKVSYYPRWHVSGATGPYRVSPNLMVVIPTAHHVVLTYGSDTSTTVGTIVTWLAIALVIGLAMLGLSRRRASRVAN